MQKTRIRSILELYIFYLKILKLCKRKYFCFDKIKNLENQIALNKKKLIH